MSIFSGILSALTGGISNLFGSGNLGSVLSGAGDEAVDIGTQNKAGNLIAKYTGSRLTDAEREANEYTASREDLYWERQIEAENTRYQRSVEDMKAAGLNPALMMSGGSQPAAGTPALNPEGSVSPSSDANLGNLLQLAMSMKLLPAQIESIKADTALKNSEASKNVELERGARIVNDFNNETAELRKKSIEADNKLKEVSHKKAYKEIDMMEANITKAIEEAHSEQEKQNLFAVQTMLAKGELSQLFAMLPYRISLLEAETESQKAMALLHATNAAYQQGLIDDGYIDSLVKKLDSESFEAECRARGIEADTVKKDLANALRSGTLPDGFRLGIPFLDRRIGQILSGTAVFLDTLNPLAGLLGGSR